MCVKFGDLERCCTASRLHKISFDTSENGPEKVWTISSHVRYSEKRGPTHVCCAISAERGSFFSPGAARLGTKEGYTGYGPEQGIADLRTKIAKNLYDDKISPDEVFVSDGSK